MSILLQCKCILNCLIVCVRLTCIPYCLFCIRETVRHFWWGSYMVDWSSWNLEYRQSQYHCRHPMHHYCHHTQSACLGDLPIFIYLFLVKDLPIWYVLSTVHTSQDSLSERLWHGAMCKRANKKSTSLNPLPLSRVLWDIQHLPSRTLAIPCFLIDKHWWKILDIRFDTRHFLVHTSIAAGI